MKNPAVTDYIQGLSQEWQVDVSNQLRQIITESVPDAEELVQWKKPHYKKNGKYLCTFMAAKMWVNFTVLSAQSVQAPTGLFEPDSRTIKVREGQSVNYELLTKFLQKVASTL